ncbi:MAG: hypothetical protein B6D36_00250 [Planctomycetes bacterium UTPLA1]|jgi:hypothetical protein|nr:MAG: hypothetical protein B6D36_00250 [Planctomycetes bacterium UTPLA1]
MTNLNQHERVVLASASLPEGEEMFAVADAVGLIVEALRDAGRIRVRGRDGFSDPSQAEAAVTADASEPSRVDIYLAERRVWPIIKQAVKERKFLVYDSDSGVPFATVPDDVALACALIPRDALQAFARETFRVEFAPRVAAASAPVPELEQSVTMDHRATCAVTTHTFGRDRRGPLDPVIDMVLKDVSNPDDHAAVWNAFIALANSKPPPAPLLEVVDGEVKYQASSDVALISRKAFMDRLRRRDRSR